MKPNDFRFVFGIGRSGTTWLSTVLSQTLTPIRFLREPLHRKRCGDNFRTSIVYNQTLQASEPLIEIYKSFLTDKCLCNRKRIIRNDSDKKYCFIKEVHGLLSIEALLNYFKCPAVLIIRDPLRVLDSLLCLPELNDTYLREESKRMSQTFLEKFTTMKNTPFKIASRIANVRSGLIAEKFLTITALNLMLQTLHKQFSNTYLVKYEELCQNPEDIFEDIFNFLDFKWDLSVLDFLRKTMFCSSQQEKIARSFIRNTTEQKNKPFKYLSEEDRRFCKDLITTKEYFKIC